MNPLRIPLFLPFLIYSAIATAQSSSANVTTADNRTQLGVTITNQDLALVKDRRALSITSGSTDLIWRDVSMQMRPETALLQSISAPGSMRVTEQNFDQQLLTPQALLEKHVGKTIDVIRTHPATGAETRERAEVLSARGGIVLKFADRIETGIPGRLSFNAIPVGLNDKPTLILSLDNRGPSKQELELDYLTSGLNWNADYVARLNDSGNSADISGSFTIVNATGTAFRNARLQLIAGDINRVRQDRPMLAEARAYAAPAPKSVSQEAFADYHLYTVNQPVTLAENQTKQIAFLSAKAVPLRREWLLSGGDYIYHSRQTALQKPKVGMFMEFDNAGKPGVPLPRGTVRIYAKDSADGMQFAGEDAIDHTPVGEKVRLKLGNAFDVTAHRRQTDFVRIDPDGKRGTSYKSSHEIVLKNAKKQAVIVTVQETIPGEWQILSESSTHEKRNSNTVAWRISVPAQGQAALTWQVQSRD